MMDDLIDMVKIDGFHSFQEVILPAAEVKSSYGKWVAFLGGVDVDKLSTLPESDLRAYFLRGILDACMHGVRFAFSSGNTIANFVPLQNFTILLEEARQ
ncbi:MAG: hypothetical protein IMZ62_00335 [Chloroflexi bacterium]|nr:hypothetical protein [Chloroflexota bacterium]